MSLPHQTPNSPRGDWVRKGKGGGRVGYGEMHEGGERGGRRKKTRAGSPYLLMGCN